MVATNGVRWGVTTWILFVFLILKLSCRWTTSNSQRSMVDSIVVFAVFADIFIELTLSWRRDPNNYSDTVTRALSNRWPTWAIFHFPTLHRWNLNVNCNLSSTLQIGWKKSRGGHCHHHEPFSCFQISGAGDSFPPLLCHPLPIWAEVHQEEYRFSKDTSQQRKTSLSLRLDMQEVHLWRIHWWRIAQPHNHSFQEARPDPEELLVTREGDIFPRPRRDAWFYLPLSHHNWRDWLC